MWWWSLHDVLASHSSPASGWAPRPGCFWAADWFWDNLLLETASDGGDSKETGEVCWEFPPVFDEISVVSSISWGLEHGFRIHEVWVLRESHLSSNSHSTDSSVWITNGNVNLVDWNDGNGTVEWTTGVEHWTRLLECHTHNGQCSNAYTISLPQT